MGPALAGGGDLAPAPGVNTPVELDLADEPIARSGLALQREADAVDAAGSSCGPSAEVVPGLCIAELGRPASATGGVNPR